MAAVLIEDIYIIEGESFSLVDTWTQAADAESEAEPVPFPVGTTAVMKIREKAEDSSALLSISTTPSADGEIVLGDDDGTITTRITKTKTATLAAAISLGVYALQVTFDDGDVVVYRTGRVFLSRNPARA